MIHTYHNTEVKQNTQDNDVTSKEEQMELLEKEQEAWERTQTAGYL